MLARDYKKGLTNSSDNSHNFTLCLSFLALLEPFFNSQLAKALFLLKNYDKAIEIYEYILNLYSEDTDSMLKLGDIYFDKADYYLASNYYSQAINCSPKNMAIRLTKKLTAPSVWNVLFR